MQKQQRSKYIFSLLFHLCITLYRHPTSGSFLRPKKADFGVRMLTGLQERYGMIDDDNAGVIEEEMFVMGKNHQQTTVEVVGFKSVNLQQRYAIPI